MAIDFTLSPMQKKLQLDARDFAENVLGPVVRGNHSGQQVTGGFQGLPVTAARSASRTLSPCLRTVEM
jgi:hypothetical protein